MGITTAILKVNEHRKSQKIAKVEFLIDSGAVYSAVPGKILDELEIEPYREMSFALADGTLLKRNVASAYFEFGSEGGGAQVIYGEEEDKASLGSTTLAAVGLILNPFNRTFHPMRMRTGNLKFYSSTKINSSLCN